MTDGNKHRYVSCVSANDGALGWIETQGGGVLKENGYFFMEMLKRVRL